MPNVRKAPGVYLFPSRNIVPRRWLQYCPSVNWNVVTALHNRKCKIRKQAKGYCFKIFIEPSFLRITGSIITVINHSVNYKQLLCPCFFEYCYNFASERFLCGLQQGWLRCVVVLCLNAFPAGDCKTIKIFRRCHFFC